jgi:pSer/pThr/pTyr-binding forkhead associated (FHA) protein
MKDHFVLRNLSTNENVPLISATVTLGRSEDCEIVVDSSEASRRHARIALEGGRLTLEDMGSTNGTVLNGRKLKAPQALGGGDIIIIGQVHYLVVAPGSAGDTTILGGRLGKVDDNYIVDQGDPNHTGLRLPFPKPPGWTSEDDFDAGLRAGDTPLDVMADQMVRQSVALESTAAALMIVSEQGRNTLFPLPTGKSSWSLGRAVGNDAEIDHITVSSTHAVISHDAGSWRLDDKQSTNGTRVNGKKVESAQLVDGDVVSLGEVELLFKAF